MENKPLLRHSLIFGSLIGGMLILISVMYFYKNLPITINPNLSSVNHLLVIAGLFLGIKKYRDDYLERKISFFKAFGVGISITAIAAFVFSIYTYIMTTFVAPSLLNEFLELIERNMVDSNYSEEMIESIMSLYNTMLSGGVIAFSEFFAKIFMGAFFSLAISFILRSRQSLLNKKTDDTFKDSKK